MRFALHSEYHLTSLLIMAQYFCFCVWFLVFNPIDALPFVVTDDSKILKIPTGVFAQCGLLVTNRSELHKMYYNLSNQLVEAVANRFGRRYPEWSTAEWYKECLDLTAENCEKCTRVWGAPNYLLEGCREATSLKQSAAIPKNDGRLRKRSLSETDTLRDFSGIVKTLDDFNDVVALQQREITSFMLSLQEDQTDELFYAKLHAQTEAIRVGLKGLEKPTFLEERFRSNATIQKLFLSSLMKPHSSEWDVIQSVNNRSLVSINSTCVKVCFKLYPKSDTVILHRFETLPISYHQGTFRIHPNLAFGIHTAKHTYKLVPLWLGQMLFNQKYTSMTVDQLFMVGAFDSHTEECFFSSVLDQARQSLCILDAKKVTDVDSFYVNMFNGSLWVPLKAVIIEKCANNEVEVFHTSSNTFVHTKCGCRYSSNGKVYRRHMKCHLHSENTVVSLAVPDLGNDLKKLLKLKISANLNNNEPLNEEVIVSSVDSAMARTDLHLHQLKKTLRYQIQKHNIEASFNIQSTWMMALFGCAAGLVLLFSIACLCCRLCKQFHFNPLRRFLLHQISPAVPHVL